MGVAQFAGAAGSVDGGGFSAGVFGYFERRVASAEFGDRCAAAGGRLAVGELPEAVGTVGWRKSAGCSKLASGKTHAIECLDYGKPGIGTKNRCDRSGGRPR